MLIGLAILSMLLAAVAAAMNASLKSYKENEDLAGMMQTARAVVNRIAREVRTADAVDSTSDSLTITLPDEGSGITQIQYELHVGELLYHVTQDGQTSTNVLIAYSDDVQISDFDVTREVGPDWQGADCTKSITVRLGLLVNGKSYAVTTSTSPRRNQLY